MIPNTDQTQSILTISLLDSGPSFTLAPLVGWENYTDHILAVSPGRHQSHNGTNYQSYAVDTTRGTIQRMNDAGEVDYLNQRELSLNAILDELKEFAKTCKKEAEIAAYILENREVMRLQLTSLKLLRPTRLDISQVLV